MVRLIVPETVAELVEALVEGLVRRKWSGWFSLKKSVAETVPEPVEGLVEVPIFSDRAIASQ